MVMTLSQGIDISTSKCNSYLDKFTWTILPGQVCVTAARRTLLDMQIKKMCNENESKSFYTSSFVTFSMQTKFEFLKKYTILTIFPIVRMATFCMSGQWHSISNVVFLYVIFRKPPKLDPKLQSFHEILPNFVSIATSSKVLLCPKEIMQAHFCTYVAMYFYIVVFLDFCIYVAMYFWIFVALYFCVSA